MTTRVDAVKEKPTKLSVREQEVAALVVEGFSSFEIGARLGIVPKTVKFHLRSIYVITGFPTRSRFIANFYKTGSYYKQTQQGETNAQG